MPFFDRLRNAYNAFRGVGVVPPQNLGPSYATRPDRVRMSFGTERSVASPLYTRIGIDVSAISMRHVRTDQNGRYLGTMRSGLNECLTTGANIDQTGRAFIMDVVLSMFDEGCVAIVPVDTIGDPELTSSYDIRTMRTGKIVQWYPRHVRVEVYNDQTGFKEQLTLPKTTVAIIENPLYSVMNEPNSTLRRLIRKLNLLDSVDEQSGSGKLDLIIQLPYVIKTSARREQAEARRRDIEDQLAGSKYGIAYTDGTERVTQLNRPAENNLMKQVEYLTEMLYSQLGLAESIFNGTADEKTLLNYYNRTVEPVLAAIADSIRRTFITKTARSQGQTIMFFRDPFRLVGATDLATISDSFTRNAILSSNDIRAVIGYAPSNEQGADELRNKNLNPPTPEQESAGRSNADADQNGKELEKDDKTV